MQAWNPRPLSETFKTLKLGEVNPTYLKSVTSMFVDTNHYSKVNFWFYHLIAWKHFF